ncbi:MAG: hypothetical protein H6898_15370 [Rhodobacter sp.]|nr:hypothetical protein [Paracoccaceae bacterium]MCC0077935.1 hypothetical protein [Rhodobacter sp.]
MLLAPGNGPTMPEDPVQRAILDVLTRRGEFVLAGNREYYTLLRHCGDHWTRVDGDPLARDGNETISTVSEVSVLQAVRARVRDRMGIYGPPDDRPDWPEVLAWLTDGRS